jgi:hypothetical protein
MSRMNKKFFLRSKKNLPLKGLFIQITSVFTCVQLFSLSSTGQFVRELIAVGDDTKIDVKQKDDKWTLSRIFVPSPKKNTDENLINLVEPASDFALNAIVEEVLFDHE